MIDSSGVAKDRRPERSERERKRPYKFLKFSMFIHLRKIMFRLRSFKASFSQLEKRCVAMVCYLLTEHLVRNSDTRDRP